MARVDETIEKLRKSDADVAHDAMVESIAEAEDERILKKMADHTTCPWCDKALDDCKCIKDDDGLDDK